MGGMTPFLRAAFISSMNLLQCWRLSSKWPQPPHVSPVGPVPAKCAMPGTLIPASASVGAAVRYLVSIRTDARFPELSQFEIDMLLGDLEREIERAVGEGVDREIREALEEGDDE
jgi:hypothetical protein